MEPTQTLYNLEAEIANWRQNMLNGALIPEDVDELIQHLRDEMSALQASGLSEEEAWLIARKRMGQPLTINEEFSKVNPDFTASRNLLMLFWGGTIFMLLQSLLFVLPHLPWFILRNTTHDKHLVSQEQIRTGLYITTALIAALVIFTLTNANKIAIWFSKVLIRYAGTLSVSLIIAGCFIGTINFRTISSSLYELSNRTGTLDLALDLAGIIFYGALIFCTAWFTMRYRKQEFRSFRIFSTNVNWAMSLGIGIMAELFVCSGNIFHTFYTDYLLTILLFTPAAWMVSRSKNPLLNLFMLQLCPFYVWWIVAYASAHQSLQDCAGVYTVTIICLTGGYLYNKKGQQALQTA